MMQKEQRLLQPSCTLRLGRVFSWNSAVENRRSQQFGVGEDVADDQFGIAIADVGKRNEIADAIGTA